MERSGLVIEMMHYDEHCDSLGNHSRPCRTGDSHIEYEYEYRVKYGVEHYSEYRQSHGLFRISGRPHGCIKSEVQMRYDISDKDDGYVNFVEETGAEYVGRMAKWIYFRRKTELGDFRLFSDLESQIGHLGKMAKTMKGVGIANLIIGMANTFNPSFAGVPIGWINLLCAALCMYAYGRIQGKLDAMEKDRALME